MNGLIKFSLGNWYAVVVAVLTVAVLGSLAILSIPIDILPVNQSPAVQVLTFYNGMPAALVEKNLSNRLERWTGQSAGTKKQESRSIIGVSIVRNYYDDDVDPNGALTQVVSLTSVATPYLPPGTLPPIVLPFDPTSTTPICLIALDSEKESESVIADVGRFEVRNMSMSIRGVVAPVVYGGKQRAVLAFMDRDAMAARGLSSQDLLNAVDAYNVFLPAGDLRLGTMDYYLDSNAMYRLVDQMSNIPVKTEQGRTVFLKDVAEIRDSHLPQMSLVRVNGRREVYVPIFRQTGASTLSVVSNLKKKLPSIESRLSYNDIKLKMVMDQSVYVKESIWSLFEEGALGAVLCSLVILLFLGEWRMTLIAIITIPIAVLASIVGLRYTGNTINVMTLAGLALALGPLVDNAIVCLENTHRHLGLGTQPGEAAKYGTTEVALPALVATCCTLLVLAPLALMPGLGRFLFRPMALAVTFAMVAAFLVSMSFVPAMCSLWLRGLKSEVVPQHGEDYQHRTPLEMPANRLWIHRLFARWEGLLNAGISHYIASLLVALRHRWLVLGGALVCLVVVVLGLGSQLRREFFPEVDSGAFEIYLRAKSGTRLEETEKRVAAVEQLVRQTIAGDLEIVISEVGVVADWSAAYTPNAGPMDAVIKVQLAPERTRSAQAYVHQIRQRLNAPDWHDLEFGFDAGGMIRSAMNEGKSTPINIQITARDAKHVMPIAESILQQARGVPGVVDARIVQRLDYPQYFIDIDQAKAASLGLNQVEVMKNVIATLNSSIQYHKKNFWIDPVTTNQYYVGVSYREKDIESLDSLLDVIITSPSQKQAIPLRNVATLRKNAVASEATHRDLQNTVDIVMNIHDRDLGHVADDITNILQRFGSYEGNHEWATYDPKTVHQDTPTVLPGSQIRLSGEYARMQETFQNLGLGLVLASILVYFLMVALFKSWVAPLVIVSAVPVGLVGVVLMLFLTRTALNVQSLLGIIFMVGIVVSNTVLMVDFAQHLRHDEKLLRVDAIVKAARLRVRPVIMTGLASFFALLPMALSLERGSEANAPLGRAVIGGLLAGLVTTLFVVPCLYTILGREGKLSALDSPTSSCASHSSTISVTELPDY
ncbi:MAG TPA: efflux RND transporter permease subunit [Gemmataceae bacterium]|nr:efflux RND transporter permease subunit [Gemmataceae bacterium]